MKKVSEYSHGGRVIPIKFDAATGYFHSIVDRHQYSALTLQKLKDDMQNDLDGREQCTAQAVIVLHIPQYGPNSFSNSREIANVNLSQLEATTGVILWHPKGKHRFLSQYYWDSANGNVSRAYEYGHKWDQHVPAGITGPVRCFWNAETENLVLANTPENWQAVTHALRQIAWFVSNLRMAFTPENMERMVYNFGGGDLSQPEIWKAITEAPWGNVFGPQR